MHQHKQLVALVARTSPTGEPRYRRFPNTNRDIIPFEYGGGSGYGVLDRITGAKYPRENSPEYHTAKITVHNPHRKQRKKVLHHCSNKCPENSNKHTHLPVLYHSQICYPDNTNHDSGGHYDGPPTDHLSAYVTSSRREFEDRQ